jgi:YesN/AraC family two-component response regulator
LAGKEVTGLLKVLVVDDEREIADYIGALIAAAFGELTEIRVLYSGPKAMDALRATHCDLLVADIRMPVTDGLALLNFAVAAELPTEVVFLTAFKEFDYIYRALMQKPITYLIKTEREDVLLKVIGGKLREIQARRSGRPKLEPSSLPEAEQWAAGGTETDAAPIQNAHQHSADMLYESRHAAAMNLVRDYIRAHIEEGVSLAALAERFHYNQCYLSQAFSRACGQKLNDYIQECKIAAAKKYLAETGEHINRIAERLSYQSPQAFIRFFKSKVGMSADEWRRFHAKIYGSIGNSDRNLQSDRGNEYY